MDLQSLLSSCKSVFVTVLIVALLSVCVQVYLNLGKHDEETCDGWYTAGVVEFATLTRGDSESPQDFIWRNAHRYVDIIGKAAEHNVDILVFPEAGLTTIYNVNHRSEHLPYLIQLPENNIAPCDLPDSNEVLKMLSCSVRTARLYAVINLSELCPCSDDQPGCPSDKQFFYNTNVVFDRNGKLIARYRKYNLFNEPEYNITAEPELTVFETDFGARFGTFICFDILFHEPALRLITEMNVTDIVFSTAWFSEIPLLTADQVQAAWAYSNNVNLLASGLNNPKYKNAGSGIYASRKGVLVAVMPEILTTQLLIAHVPLRDNLSVDTISKGSVITFDSNSSEKGLDFYHDDLKQTTTKVLSSTSQSDELYYVYNDYMCNITVTYNADNDSPNSVTYRLIAFSGERTYVGLRTVTIEICAVIACAGEDITSCGQRPLFDQFSSVTFQNIEISLKSKKYLSTFPVTLDQHILPLDTDYFVFDKSSVKQDSVVEESQSMSLKKAHNELISFGIFRD